MKWHLYWKFGGEKVTLGKYRWKWQAYVYAFYLKFAPAVNPLAWEEFYLEQI